MIKNSCLSTANQIKKLLYCHYRHIKKVIINTIIITLLLLLFRWRHAAVVVAVYLLMEQCGGMRGYYESYKRLAGMSEDNALG